MTILSAFISKGTPGGFSLLDSNEEKESRGIARFNVNCYSLRMEIQKLKFVCEAALFAAGEPVSLKRLLDLFTDKERPTASEMKKILAELTHDYRDRGIHLKQLASGYCFQTDSLLHDWIKRLWPEKPPRYSRAFLETLSIIAYKQPVTRGDIEAIRGVAVSPQIIKVLLEQAWIQVVGQREVPGRPNLYATSTLFLDHFGLKTVSELPPFPSKTNEVNPCPRADYHNTI